MVKKIVNKAIPPDETHVDIFGQTFKIKSDGDREYIKELASQVNAKMEEIASASGTKVVDSYKVAMLSLLHIADELQQTRHNYQTKSDAELKNSDTDPKYSESLLASFDFPLAIKASCEQYLLYFAQFLLDLGIHATSNLEEQAGAVLFSVTPTDDKQALGKIREALAIFLNLPSSPIVYDDSFAAMRLKQQVDNLQHSQKMAEMEFRLAQRVIESQDRAIGEKNVTIEQQSRIIETITSKSRMIDSAENKEELERICEGLQIGQSKFLKEQFGIHVNPATVLKTMGQAILGKQETTSIIEPEDASKLLKTANTRKG